MKNEKMILGIVLIMSMAFSACTQQYDPESDFEVTKGSKSIVIKKYVGKKRVVNIPPTIQGLPVTSIGYEAFQNKNLTQVIIPDSVTSIGDGAFWVNKIKSVTIPNSVTSIGKKAFCYNKLKSVTIPDSVTTIGDWAFMSNKLKNVSIGSGLDSIGSGVFAKDNYTSNIENSKFDLYAKDIIRQNQAMASQRQAQKEYELANVSMDKNDYTNAIIHYRKALELNRNHTDAKKNLQLVWDRRIANNQQLYPAPFEGKWKILIQEYSFIPPTTETYYEDEHYVEYSPYRDSLGFSQRTHRTRKVQRTRTIPGYSKPEKYLMYQFNGANFSVTAFENGKQTGISTGTFFYNDGNIELENGTKLVFRNGVIVMPILTDSKVGQRVE